MDITGHLKLGVIAYLLWIYIMSLVTLKKYKIRVESTARGEERRIILDELEISAENKNIAVYIYLVTNGLYREKSYMQCVQNCFTEIYSITSGNIIVEEVLNDYLDRCETK